MLRLQLSHGLVHVMHFDVEVCTALLVEEPLVVIILICMKVVSCFKFILAPYAPNFYFIHDVLFHFLVFDKGHIIKLELVLVFYLILFEPFGK